MTDPGTVSTSDGASGELGTIVVADDAPEVRTLIRAALRLDGRFRVVAEAADGIEAVALAGEHRPTIVLLDVSMPRVDGFQALPRVLEVSPGTRVVLFSGFEEQGLATRAAELGASAFVEKSVPVESLLERLAEVAATAGHPSYPVRTGGDPVADPEPGQRVLDEHLERFREVFDQAAIGMATMTLAGRLVRVNVALLRLLRAEDEHLVGTAYAALAGEASGDVAAALERIRTVPVDAVRVEHRLHGDPNRLLLATMAPVRDSRGRPLYVFLQVQDVTAERAALAALRRSEERFRLLVETVQEYAIFMLDPTGHVVSWNAGAQRSTGYTAEQIVGRHFSVFYPPEVVESGHCERELDLALRDGRYEEEGWRIRRDGTRFWATVLITAVHDHEGRHVGFAKVTRDTSERRRLETEREQALEALAGANHELESLSDRLRQAAEDQAQFLAVTAHELRTPVGVLAGSAELLARHAHELSEDERADLVRTTTSSATRLRRLLDDLLTASRLQASSLSLERNPVDVADVVADAAATVRRAEAGADLRVDGLPRGLIVSGDRDRLAQALENLLVNALRYGAPPVTVEMVADGAPETGAPETGAPETGGMVRVRVSDRGPGVSPDVLPRLFTRFSSGTERHGTGLGLFIVRELARAHGGEASYEPATDGRRGCFVIALPLVRSDPHVPERTSQ